MHKINNKTMILGKKIRFFRERAKMNQLQLELAIGASSGQISRIEKGLVNPTKETILNVSKILELTERELNYLTGSFVVPATLDEVEKARKNVAEYMNRRFALAYMVDERMRVWAASDMFIKAMGVDKAQAKKLYGMTLIRILLDPEINLAGLLDKEYVDEVLYNLFCRFYREMGFMIGDACYDEALKYIMAEPYTREIWKKAISQKQRDVHDYETRKVVFKLGPLKIKMFYSVEAVLNNERFEIVEYIPSNKLLKYIVKQ